MLSLPLIADVHTFRGDSSPISVGELELTLANAGLQLDGIFVCEGWIATQSVQDNQSHARVATPD